MLLWALALALGLVLAMLAKTRVCPIQHRNRGRYNFAGLQRLEAQLRPVIAKIWRRKWAMSGISSLKTFTSNISPHLAAKGKWGFCVKRASKIQGLSKVVSETSATVY